MKNSKKWLYCLLAALIIFGSFRFYYRLTDDFRLGNIIYQIPFDTPWTVLPLNSQEHQNLTNILSQKFHYIGKGAQCYAFASEDEVYVLKFFKFKHLKPNIFIDLLPSIPPFKNFKQSCVERKKRKLISVFNGHELAFRENRQESQLIYLHLRTTDNLHLHAKVTDKIGLEREINLDDVIFLIQKKGETLQTRLSRLLKQNRLQEAEQAISSILAMYISEYKRGIFDHDHGVMHNTGFIGTKPFHLDVGKLNKDDRFKLVDVYKKDLEHVVWKMDDWIKHFYPQFYREISRFLEQEYHLWTGEVINIKGIDPERFKRKH